MGNISQKDLEIIESILESSTTDFEKRMKTEYETIKKSIQINTTQKTSVIDSPTIRAIINPIKPKKRLVNFYRWFKMIFNEESDDFHCQSSQENPSDSSKEKITKSTSLSNNYYSFHSTHHLSKNDDISLLYLNRSSSFYEINLRRFFFGRHNEFLTRTSKGPPNSLRWLSWMILINTPSGRSQSIYKQFASEILDEKTDIQITKDLNRTFSEITIPINTVNPDKAKEGESLLNGLLRALAFCDKELGYCQGINFITGYLLLVSDFNETETFYLLVGLFSKTFHSGFNIRGFFIDNFPMLNCFIYIFDSLLLKELPELHKHLHTINIPYEVWIGKWMQTLYTLCLPYELNLRLWDNVLTYGIDFIIAFSISLVKEIQEDLLKIKDAFDYSDYFKDIFFTFSTSRIVTKKSKKTENAKVKVSLFENILLSAKKLYKTHKKTITQLKVNYEVKEQMPKISLVYNLTYKLETECSSDTYIKDISDNNSPKPKNYTTSVFKKRWRLNSSDESISDGDADNEIDNDDNDNENEDDYDYDCNCDCDEGVKMNQRISIGPSVFNNNKRKDSNI